MKVLLLISICLFLALSVLAKEPCQPPPLLEGKFSGFSSTENMNIIGFFSSDQPGRRFRLREEIQGSSYTVFEDLLMLFSEKIMYMISYTNSTCIKMPLDVDLYPMELPPKAQYLNQAYVGSSVPGAGVLVDIWTGTHPMIKGQYIISTTNTDCIPISSVYNIQPIGTLITAYFDVVYGIEDPNVFTPPSFCNEAS